MNHKQLIAAVLLIVNIVLCFVEIRRQSDDRIYDNVCHVIGVFNGLSAIALIIFWRCFL